MASFEFLAITLTGLGLIVSILYYTFTLQNANKTRQAQLFIQICNQTLNNPIFMKGYYVIMSNNWKDFDEYLKFLGEPGSENWNDVFLVGGILESIGVLVAEGLIDISLVASLMARVVIEYGEKVVPMLHERAQLWRQTRMQQGKTLLEMRAGAQWKAEYLYHKLMKYIEAHPGLAT
jgi:hypothetical protein